MNNSIIQEIEFQSLREDWYWSNEAMPRYLSHVVNGTRELCFVGFPRQWIPVFEWYGAPWRLSTEPDKYMPFFSDFTEEEILQHVRSSREGRALRCLAEFSSICDGVIADCLNRVDHSILPAENAASTSELLLTSWQAYGRPEVRLVDRAIAEASGYCDNAIILPCSKSRPYGKSITHRKIYRQLEEQGIRVSQHDRVVITALGVLPETLWEMPQVLTYEAGVADVYRLLCLARGFFARAKYNRVYDCLSYRPYSDVLQIVQREGLIDEVIRPKLNSRRRRGPTYV